MVRKIILLFINGLGVGPMPDSGEFHDRKVNTLGHLATNYPDLHIPNLIKMGLSHLTFMENQPKPPETIAYFSRFRSATTSNDSLSVLWEMAGLRPIEIYQNYPLGFPEEMLEELTQISGYKFLIKSSMGINDVIKKFADEHLELQQPLLFNSGNCDLILSSHVSLLNEEQLFELGQKVFPVVKKYNIAKLRITPFEGVIGEYNRVTNAETFLAEPPTGVSIFSLLEENDIPVVGDNRIGTAFNFEGFEKILPSENIDVIFKKLVQNIHNMDTDSEGRAVIVQGIYEFYDEIIPNKNSDSYVFLLEKIDKHLPKLLRSLQLEDILFITSLAGGDTTSNVRGITREYLPFFLYSPSLKPFDKGNLGIRSSMKDISETILRMYAIENSFDGENFWELIQKNS